MHPTGGVAPTLPVLVQSTEAIYSDGVLKPINPLQLREHQRVKVTIEPIEPGNDEERRRAMDRFIEGTKRMNFRSTGPYPTRDELHERD